jgi:hypothetical protein
MKTQIEKLLEYVPMTERIALLESLCKKYRRLNSQKINNLQMGRKVIDEDRPDLLSMKN